MKKNAMIWLSSVVLAGACVGVCVAHYKSTVVGVPGYEHANAVCGIKGPSKEKAFRIEGKVITWSDDYAMYSVNWGHENDPQLEELAVIAKSFCSK